MKETLIILGDSPFLKEVEDKIRYVLCRYYSVGINRVISRLQTNMHAFVDMKLVKFANSYEKIVKLTPPMYSSIVKGEKEVFGTFSFDFNKPKCLINNKNELAWCGFTHDYVISYAIHKKYKRVVLIGAADFIKGNHFSCGNKFQYSSVLKEASRKFICEVCTKKLEIATCNPNSYLDIPYIPIDDLLK